MSAEHELPTWNEITRKARASLNAARADIADARDWLTSDWRPFGTSLSEEAAHTRSETVQLLSQINDLVERAKDELARAENGTGREQR